MMEYVDLFQTLSKYNGKIYGAVLGGKNMYTSELQFEQEFGNSFHGTSNTLISTNTLLSLKSLKPIKHKLFAKPKIMLCIWLFLKMQI